MSERRGSGSTPAIAAANRVNEIAERVAGAPVFDFPAIVKGINFDTLAAAFPRCWACTLGTREPPRKRKGAEDEEPAEEESEEPKVEEKPRKGKKPGMKPKTPLRGARVA